jgi:hypothetical protein
MRINQAKRIYMNEADSSPGNGAPVAPAASAEPSAASTAPVFDPDALVSRLMGAFEEKLAAHQNATNAALRKAGVFKQEKAAESAPVQAQSTSSAPSAQAGLSAADLDARFELERVIASREAKHGLSEAQARRLRSALSGVSRDALASEADSYLSDLGLVKAATQPTVPTQAQAIPAQPAKPNISDRGTAAPTDTRDSEGVLNSRPLEITSHDIDALVLKHGREKGMEMFQERVLAALGQVRIKPPSGGRQR